MSANSENLAMAKDWERSVFIPILKKVNAKECSNYHTIALISHASKVMLKILQSRLQQYLNRELEDVQVEFSTLTASSLRILNSSAGIPSPPLVLFIVMLPKAHLTSHSRMSGSR